MNKQSLIAHLRELNEWNTPTAAGRARAVFESNIAAHINDMPLISMPFGNEIGIVSGNGNLYDASNLPEAEGQHEVESDEDHAARLEKTHDLRAAVARAAGHVGWLRDVSDGIPAGASPTTKMIDDMRIPAGLVLIVAGGGAGKTPLAHALAGYGDAEYGVVRFGEPLAGYTSDARVAAGLLGAALIRHREVVLDSVKDVMSMMPGGAMQSGISRSVLPLFTQWATTAANAGATLYVPLNPSSPNKDLVDLLIEAAKSNSTTTIYSDALNHWHYQSRGGEGLVRARGTFTSKYLESGIMEIQTGGVITGAPSLVASTSPFDLSDEGFGAALRRSIRSQQAT